MIGRWAPLAGLWIAVQLVATAVLALALGQSQLPPWRSYFDISLFLVSFGTVGYGFWLLRRLPPDPIHTLRYADRAPLARLYVGCLLLYGQFVTLTWMKCLMPLATNFWGDAVLFAFERRLFGTDAWRIFPEGNDAMTFAYAYWPAVVTAVFTVAVMRSRGAACFAFFLTVGGLGVFGQYLLPSAGPIFWKDVLGVPDFQAAIPPSMTFARDYLWAAYRDGQFLPAGGISAFPSVHVGCAMWVALTTRHLLGWLFWVLVLLASIAFGWHYFSGVAFGSLAAVGFWFLAHRLLGQPAPAAVAEPVVQPA